MARRRLHTPGMSNGTNPPKKRGCLFYGCLSMVILGLVLALMLGIGLYVAKRTVTKLINDYSDSAPQTIETVTYPPPQRQALQAQLDAFKAAVDGSKSGVELVLTATDLNVLIGENPDLKGKLFLTLDNDKVTGKVSIPLDDFGPLKLKGRYLNGTAALRVALESGQLDVRVDSVEVRGKPLPGPLSSELKKNNLAQNANQNPDQAKQLEKISSLQIKDGKVILRSK
jgi:hypothetical protein